MKLGTNIQHISGALLKRFSRSEVKGEGYSKTKCTFCGRGIHVDGAASRLTSRKMY